MIKVKDLHEIKIKIDFRIFGVDDIVI